MGGGGGALTGSIVSPTYQPIQCIDMDMIWPNRVQRKQYPSFGQRRGSLP